ncbi:MAG TPA: TadE family protein [Candidatus Limnocylindrales bacterium]|nr:TadE family protein [Candidatus Limnocylindrales bacterium]
MIRASVARRLHGERAARRSGQSIVEFAVALPVFMMLLLGMLEFGLVFSHHIGLEYATREGARMAAALGSGTDQVVCSEVDKNVIAALQRVLTSPGSQIAMANVSEIRIYAADASGLQIGGLANVWIPGTGPTVDGYALKFSQSSLGWNACGRKNSWTLPNNPPDSVGVSLTYRYDLVTPLGNLVRAFSSGSIRIDDRTVMAINPT